MTRSVGAGVPLRESQIAAAVRLHARLEQWTLTDGSLAKLRLALPDARLPETLIKVVVLNALYGTNVFALIHTAQHFAQVIARTQLADADASLVEQLAMVPARRAGEPVRRRVSLAAKYAHFFIDEDRFPIFDSYAVEMVAFHLGASTRRDNAHPYLAHVGNLKALLAVNNLKCSYRDLDRYLWIAGQYSRWRKSRGTAKQNVELSALFREPSTADALDLRAVEALEA